MTPTESVTLRDIHKSFGDNEVLRGISLSGHQGDVISVLGSSGTGKSTLLRCINLLEIPDRGALFVSGEEVLMRQNRKGVNGPADAGQVVRIRAKLAMVFQQFNLWSHMTILENVIEAPVHVLKVPRKEARDRARLYLEKVGIPDKADAYPAHLQPQSTAQPALEAPHETC
jgi:ABC-type histidine transport system ATPase subunit